MVVQDVRGTGDSEGEFIPFLNEGADGATSVESSASLPFSTGHGFAVDVVPSEVYARHNPYEPSRFAPTGPPDPGTLVAAARTP